MWTTRPRHSARASVASPSLPWPKTQRSNDVIELVLSWNRLCAPWPAGQLEAGAFLVIAFITTQ